MNLNLLDIEERIRSKFINKSPKFNGYANSYNWRVVRNSADLIDKGNLLDLPERELSCGIDNSVNRYVCFGRFLSIADSDRGVIFEISAERYLKGSILTKDNNLCWWTKEEITFWIDSLRQEADLNFYFKVVLSNSRVFIKFDFSRLTRLQKKLVLFWTRNLYELPASFYVLDTLMLKQNYFPEESLVNLLTLTTTCGFALDTYRNARAIGGYISASQNFSVGGKFVTLKRLSALAHRREVDDVTYIFRSQPYSIIKNSDKHCIFGKYVEPLAYTEDETLIDSWFNHSKDRFEKYVQFYPEFKKHERVRTF